MPLYDLHFAKTSFLEDSVALFWPDLSELSPNFGVLEIRGQWHRPPMSLVRRLLRLRLVKLGGECTSSNPFPLLPLRVLDFLQLSLWRQGMWLLKDLTLTSVFALSQSSLHLLLWTPFPLLDPFSHVNDEYKESCLMIRQVILSSPTHVRSMIHAKRDIIIEWLIIICCSVSVKLFPRFFSISLSQVVICLEWLWAASVWIFLIRAVGYPPLVYSLDSVKTALLRAYLLFTIADPLRNHPGCMCGCSHP